MFYRALILIVFIFYSSSAEESTERNVLVFEPDTPVQVFEDETVPINVTFNGTGHGDTVFIRVRLIADTHLERVRQLTNDTFEFNFVDGEWLCDGNCSVEVLGVFIGESELTFSKCAGTNAQCLQSTDFQPLSETCHVYVSRRPRTLDTVFTVVLVIFGCIVNLGMGCKIDLQIVKDTLRRPIAPAVGFFCQFAFMPVLAFAYSKAMSLSPSEAVGLFANGCSPGGGASNMWTLLFNGDVSLSVTMTVVSTFASLGMFPFWMFTLGRLIIGKSFIIAFENIIISLVGIVIPVIIGLVVQRFKPKIAKIISKSLKPIMFCLLIFMFTVGIWINFFMFKLFTPRLIIASCLLPWSGFLSGFLASLITRRQRSHIIAITLETGIQNTGVSIMTLRLSLPQPQNDLSIVGAVCPSLFTASPLLLAYLGYAIYNRIKKQRNVELKEVEMGVDDCPGTPASIRSTVNLTERIKRRKSVPW